MSVGSRLRWLLPLAIAIAIPACGGGADTLPSQTCIDFTAEADPTTRSVILRKGADSACCCVAVELVATDLVDIHTVTLTLVFDPDQAEFRDVSLTGSILAADGAHVEIIESLEPRRLVLGLSRVGSDTGVDATGSRKLATLYFTAGAHVGTSPLSVIDGSIFDSETPPVKKQGVAWSGGTLSLR